MGILVCGLNGTGKSTLGMALAEKLCVPFLDNEALFFPRPGDYAAPRSREEATRLLLKEAHAHPDFVFAAVRGDYGPEILPFYRLVILLQAPKALREQRLRARSFGRFGARMQPGGDLFEQEEGFFRAVLAWDESYVEDWVGKLSCPVLRLDGGGPFAENLAQAVWAARA